MSRSTNLCVVAGLLISIVAAPARGWTGDATIELIDATGSSSIGHGTFHLTESYAFSIEGNQIYRDFNLDGLSDSTLAQVYQLDLALGFEYVILELNPGNVTAYSHMGSLSSTFDWSLTVYESAVASGPPLDPVGSAFFGHATLEDDRTLLHISESLLWTSGLFIGDWAGYKLDGLVDLAISTNESGAFVLETLPVPAPPSLLVLAALAMFARRRRR